jgi:hypothetical protein
MKYVPGARERSSVIVRRLVLGGEQPPDATARGARARGETQLFVNEVKLSAARYILCLNEAEAERERNGPIYHSSDAAIRGMRSARSSR